MLVLATLVSLSASFTPVATVQRHASSAVHTLAAPQYLPTAAPSLRVAAHPVAVASSSTDEEKLLDVGALGRYIFAILIQMILVSTAFGAIDLYCYGPLPGGVELGGPLPWQAVVGIFIAMSLRSRVFSVLDNSRPELREQMSPADDVEFKEKLYAGKFDNMKVGMLRDECEKRGLSVDTTMDRPELRRRLDVYFDESERGGGVFADRIVPSWMPPGVVFPLMWVGVVAPLRAFASSMVYEASTGRLNEAHLNDPVILWLVLHLSLGDTWNTINNVERRLGAAVPGVAVVLGSTLYAAKQYYDIAPTAGLLLGATAVWITVAGALVADTWRLNNAVEAEPLYPWKREGRKSETRFAFDDWTGI